MVTAYHVLEEHALRVMLQAVLIALMDTIRVELAAYHVLQHLA